MLTNETRKIVRIDLPQGVAAPALQEEHPAPGVAPNWYYPISVTFGKLKFYVWETDAYTAGVNCRMENRYKLYQSAPLNIQIISPNGALETATLYPWTPVTKQIARIDEKTGDQLTDVDNGELLYDNLVEWVEDHECHTAKLSEAAQGVSSDVIPEAVLKELQIIKDDLAAKDKKISALSSAVVNKDATIKKLKEDIANLKAKKPAPAVETEGK